ncbi:hypothetical protein BDP81DRAFT_55768 [Colletotrichum phormii]|uniref:Uncharacterized protein n=1 Tax=Colletotrichum phormii TaxID=359342 RepID=A0AAI9ZM59_9PEZI|nr:uncharacterized protein BDP81DRAFT_55768 [Colletotrichum phormii]KAK1634215.1 hypothetical protein BDP81DRAFT_55768 [Colletotrichum phormii]
MFHCLNYILTQLTALATTGLADCRHATFLTQRYSVWSSLPWYSSWFLVWFSLTPFQRLRITVDHRHQLVHPN